jgi:hypothetical protein
MLPNTNPARSGATMANNTNKTIKPAAPKNTGGLIWAAYGSSACSAGYDEYREYLSAYPEEAEGLAGLMLVTVSRFFPGQGVLAGSDPRPFRFGPDRRFEDDQSLERRIVRG